MSQTKPVNRRNLLIRGAAMVGGAASNDHIATSGAAKTVDTKSLSSGYVIDQSETVSREIIGATDRFQVRRVFCLGRNYAAHAIESDDDPTVNPPFFFIKPRDAVVDSRNGFPYPQVTKALRYEAETLS